MTVAYLIGSLKNPDVMKVAMQIEKEYPEVEAFCDWLYAGPEADDYWQTYTRDRGLSYRQALSTAHAQHVFSFDKLHLDRADFGILVMPAGKSGHVEMGYLVGKGVPVILHVPEAPERYDVMPGLFCGLVTTSIEELLGLVGQMLKAKATVEPTEEKKLHLVKD